MAKCRVCNFETDEKVCPQCGSPRLMVEWVIDRRIKFYLHAIYFFSLVNLFILSKIVPTFADVFKSFDAKLPAPTQFTIGLSAMHGFSILALALTGIYGFFLKRRDFRLRINTGILAVLFLIVVFFALLFVGTLFMPMFEIGNIKG